MIKHDIEESNARISMRIDSTRSGLTETTQTESHHTRDKVDGTLVIVSKLKEDVKNTKEGISVVNANFFCIFVFLLRGNDKSATTRSLVEVTGHLSTTQRWAAQDRIYLQPL